MNRPILIGVSANREFANFPNSLGLDRTYINSAYIHAIRNAGAIPVILPIVSDQEALYSLVETVDAVLLSGGSDISPLRYGAQPLPQCGAIDPLVDEFNMNLVEITLKQKKPLFGICRGIQVINVALGGTLIQDIASHVDHALKHDQHGLPSYPSHDVTIRSDGFLYSIYGQTTAVNSLHHQAVDHLGNSFKVAATSKDGVIEAIEGINQPIYGVQWHPELMADADNPDGVAYFKWMVETIKSYD